MSFAKDINYMRNVMHHPCKPGGIDVFLETGLRAAVVALITFHTPDCNDIVVERAKEQFGKGRSRGHRSVKPTGVKRFGAAGANQGAFLFRNVVLPGRAVGSGFFMVGIGVAFIANWTTMLYAASGCEGPGHEYLDAPFGFPFVYLPGFPGRMLIGGDVIHGCVNVGFNTFSVQPGCLSTVTYQCNWINDDPVGHPGATVRTRLVTDEGYASAWNQTPPDQPGKPSQTLGGLSNVKVPGFGSTNGWVEQEVADGPMRLTGGSISISSSGHAVDLVPIPGCILHPASEAVGGPL